MKLTIIRRPDYWRAWTYRFEFVGTDGKRRCQALTWHKEEGYRTGDYEL